MIHSNAHFSRIEPVVGTGLRRARVAVLGLPAAAPLVAHLAACGVGRWLLVEERIARSAQRTAVAGRTDAGALLDELRARHGEALRLEAQVLPARQWSAAVRRAPPDLVLAAGDADTLRPALDAAATAGIPALLVVPPAAGGPCCALLILPGDDTAGAAAWLDGLAAGAARADSAPQHAWRAADVDRAAGAAATQQLDATRRNLGCVAAAPLQTPWEWVTGAPFVAGIARAILLRGTPFARADLEDLWAQGVRALAIGGAHPFDLTWSALAPQRRAQSAICNLRSAIFRTPENRRGALLIAGLGSLGSVAAEYLAAHAASFVLADPERVDAYNPVRQAYGVADLGRPKAHALRDRLIELRTGRETGGRPAQSAICNLQSAIRDERQVAELVARHGITTALVTTGTDADFAIARALRALDVPHVVGRCYPRARYWEAVVVDGRRGPAFADIRGQTIPGPAAPLTPEQRAAYSDAGALEAEPATLVESGWAAAWLARIAWQLLAPAGLRERWLLELLAAGRTCLVGGSVVEHTGDGPAYGVAAPGEIHAWGRELLTR
jgi:hypothetical protein